MALNITNVYEEYEKELKLALTCQWCAGLLVEPCATCRNCGGHNIESRKDINSSNEPQKLTP